jgi:hypothetical protein
MPNDFQYDLFLSHSAKDKPVVRVSSLSASNGERAGVRCRSQLSAERLHAKAEVRRKKEEIELQLSAFILQPLFCAFGSDWAQLACPAVAPERRRKAGTFRFRDPLNRERRNGSSSVDLPIWNLKLNRA